MSDKIRDAFEVWADSQWPGAKGEQLKRSETSPSHYANFDYHFMWTGWQAAIAQQPAPAVREEWRYIIERVVDELDALNCAFRDQIDDEMVDPEEEFDQCKATDELIEQARALLATGAAAPDGWKLVPVRATREQVNAVFMHPDLARTLYRSMVEAAPAAPVAVHDDSEAQQCLFVLREIASMDADDIDGDNIDLRFEDAEGRDTGCDASIVEYAQRAADVIERLLSAAPAAPVAGQEPVACCPYCGGSSGRCDQRFPHPRSAEQLQCTTCNGHGLVGGFVSADSGYDAEDCPDCSAAEQPDTVKVPRELLRITEQMLQFYLTRLYGESAEGSDIRTAEAAAAELRALLSRGEK